MDNKLALLVGINWYPYLGDLKCARNDAICFAQAIQRYWGFAPDEVVTMTDNSPGVLNATRELIFDQLENARNKGDLKYFIFGFWGHGFLAEDGSNRYLCLSATRENRLATSSLSFNDLFADITQIGALNTLLVNDCCQALPNRGGSNMMTNAEETLFAQYAATTARNVKIRRRERNFALDVDPTVGVLNGCSSGQLSYEIPNGDHGVFTEAVLQVMAELASRGNGSVGDLANSVNSRVNAVARRYGKTQNSYSEFKGAGPFSFPTAFSGQTDSTTSTSGASSAPCSTAVSFSEALREAIAALEKKVDGTSYDPLEQIRAKLDRAQSSLESARTLLNPNDFRGRFLLEREERRCQAAKERLDNVEMGWKVCDEGKYGEALNLAEAVLEEEPEHAAALELKKYAAEQEQEKTVELPPPPPLIGTVVLPPPPVGEDVRSGADSVRGLVSDPDDRDALGNEKEKGQTIADQIRKIQAGRLKREADERYKNQRSFFSWSNRASRPGEQRALTINGIECAFSFVPRGTFMMGSPVNEKKHWYDGDETFHQVNLSQNFWLTSYLVTQELYWTVTGKNPSSEKNGRFPVTDVNWFEAMEFAEKMNSIAGLPFGWRFDLPTEAMWEYACRAGTSTPYWFGTELTKDKANYGGGAGFSDLFAKGNRRGSSLTEVGRYPGNAWNLFDMHGSVEEWCKDCYANYPTGTVTDPCVESGSDRVARGGSWRSAAKGVRSARRSFYDPSHRSDDCGFRLALVRK